jgi:hypothetical protein
MNRGGLCKVCDADSAMRRAVLALGEFANAAVGEIGGETWSIKAINGKL